ncbi:Hypothetical protein CINCED_3A018028 [Cinara cedri]|uniref:Uncharacterized protein n=1 Tax=Cinara cedri TaxID=506608 RepID=A0A5E4N483_9HEMI|nr:Hypothetical protein CINCED_3A018028 [Cinara cedri]
MSKSLRDNWSCSTCKTKKTSLSPSKLSRNTQIVTDKTLKNVIDSVNFMSFQFVDFNHQLQQMFTKINDLKSESKRISEENVLLKKETVNLSWRLNKLVIERLLAY